METNKYQITEKLGEGAYGAVYKARQINTNEYVAIKTIKISDDDDGIPSTSLR